MGFASELYKVRQEYEREHPLLAQLEKYSNIPGKEILYNVNKQLVQEIEKHWGEASICFYLEVNRKSNPDEIILQSQMYDTIESLFENFISAIDFVDSEDNNTWLMIYSEDKDMDRLADINFNGCYYIQYK